MSLIRIQADKKYLIEECRIRFEAPADIPPNLVPLYAFKTIEWSKDRFERFKGWRFLDRVPARKAFAGGKPCCTQIVTRKPGESLTIKFMPSDFQGDTDDAHNFGTLSDKESRILIDNTIDWVAVMHFWVPAITVNQDEENEFRRSQTYAEGFAQWDALPTDAWTALREKFQTQ